LPQLIELHSVPSQGRIADILFLFGLRRVHWSKEASSLGCGVPQWITRDQTQYTLDDRYNGGSDHQAMVLPCRLE
jgi:hypothetical protein